MAVSMLAHTLRERGLLGKGDAFVADLHVHSTVSDGSDRIECIAADAASRGLTHIALTNHDTTAGLAHARRVGEAAGVRVIGGVEISAYDFVRDRKVHVIGLDMRESSPAVAALCEATLTQRDANSRWQLDRLIEAGYEVDVARVEKLAAASTCLYKQHIMEGLTDEPRTSEAYRALYRSIFKGDGICARDIAYVDAHEAVRAIVEDGGMPVLAHPGQLDSWDLLPDLVACGLSGIEAIHPDHGENDVRRAEEAAAAHELFCTGGSDYHGRFGAALHVGFCCVRG